MLGLDTRALRATLPRCALVLLAGVGALLAAHAGRADAAASAVSSDVPAPTVTGPIAGGLRGGPWGGSIDDLASYDYVENEYFFSGIAQSRDPSGEPTGRSASYTTRLLIRRPRTQAAFNGTVLMEWFNVTAEMDFGVLWGMTHAELLRRGYAYAGVSVQKVGVDASPLALKFWDPVRYAPLRHPGDAYAFDIWSQAARALVAHEGPAPLGKLRIQRIIASGESQSAAYMLPYANRVDPEHRAFDGFLVHTFPGQVPAARVPVLIFLTETEKEGSTSPAGGLSVLELGGLSPLLARWVPALGLLNVPAPQPPAEDTPRVRVWEVAGGSHYDRQALDYMSNVAFKDVIAPLPAPPASLPLTCGLDPINQLGQERAVRAALHALNRWVITGDAPPSMPRLQQDANGALVRDDDGLAQGGIRLPPMTVPVGVNEGRRCIFFGSFNPFSNAQIRDRYPTALDYRGRVEQAARKAVRRGWLLQEGADAYVEEARDVDAWR